MCICWCPFIGSFQKRFTLPPQRRFLPSGRGRKIVSDNSKCIRTSKGGRVVNFQFPPWGSYGCFLEWPISKLQRRKLLLIQTRFLKKYYTVYTRRKKIPVVPVSYREKIRVGRSILFAVAFLSYMLKVAIIVSYFIFMWLSQYTILRKYAYVSLSTYRIITEPKDQWIITCKWTLLVTCNNTLNQDLLGFVSYIHWTLIGSCITSCLVTICSDDILYFKYIFFILTSFLLRSKDDVSALISFSILSDLDIDYS